MRPSVHCQRFQFYWNLNHPPPSSSRQEEVGFQQLQKPQTAQISPKRNFQIRFVLYCRPNFLLIWTDTMKSYKQFRTLSIILNRTNILWECLATSFSGPGPANVGQSTGLPNLLLPLRLRPKILYFQSPLNL